MKNQAGIGMTGIILIVMAVIFVCVFIFLVNQPIGVSLMPLLGN